MKICHYRQFNKNGQLFDTFLRLVRIYQKLGVSAFLVNSLNFLCVKQTS